MSTLYVPLALAALGIVLRGAGFAFRKSIESLEARRAMGATFAISSVLTPFFMGTVVGAVAAGNVPADGNGDAFSSWIAAAAAADRRAVRRQRRLPRRGLPGRRRAPRRRGRLERYFARRALAAGARRRRLRGRRASSPLHAEARYVFDRLIDQGAAAGDPLGALRARRCSRLLLRGGRRPRLRPLAVGAVVAVIWGWGVAQFPYLLPDLAEDQPVGRARGRPSTRSWSSSSSPRSSSCPSLGLLYWLSQRDMLGD